MKAVLIPLIYLVAGGLILPGAALAYYIASVESAIRQGDLIKLVLFLLVRMCQTLEWGMFIVAPTLVAWLVLAFLEKYRWIGASGMALVALVTLVELSMKFGLIRSLTEGDPFVIAAILGLGVNVWLAWAGSPWVLGK